MPDRDQVYLLAIVPRWSATRILWFMFAAYGLGTFLKDPAAKLRDQLAQSLVLPGTFFVAILGGQRRAVRRRIREAPGSQIWPMRAPPGE